MFCRGIIYVIGLLYYVIGFLLKSVIERKNIFMMAPYKKIIIETLFIDKCYRKKWYLYDGTW